jgi:nitrite reductase (NO-forming)
MKKHIYLNIIGVISFFFLINECAVAEMTAPQNISRDPTDLPKPLQCDGTPHHVRIDLEAVELIGWLKKGTPYHYWTFNGKVPGPFFRACVGDNIEVHLKNQSASAMGHSMEHSVDFHAATGPGGGSVYTSTSPGGESSFTFKALKPGLFVYHCATPPVSQHISNGMYGMILIEPKGGLTPVDHEFYIMQGEIYATTSASGQVEFNYEKMLAEHPEFIVFNGKVGALTEDHPLRAKTGETVRLFFGVGGPNLISSFHVIGEIFDRVYNLGSLTSPPLTDVQTVLVSPGGSSIVEFKIKVPGTYTIVDHALSRMEKGLVGSLIVKGAEKPEIFRKGK